MSSPLIYLYPANKMENLLLLFNKIHQVSPLPIFSPEMVVVQNAGMQHWLNMSVAQSRKISFNINYALPAQFLWKLIRTLAGDEIPEQSPYSREVLTWRLYQLLNNPNIINDHDFCDVKNYLLDELTSKHDKLTQADDKLMLSSLKRYQLAVQLADLFEQYLVFRPDWLNNWQQGQFDVPLTSTQTSAETNTESSSPDLLRNAKWQGKLWYVLQKQSPYNPQTLLKLAIDNLATYQHKLPARISFFGINAMAPMWLEFIEKLSGFTQVHFFHLNPCADYWGDLQTDKQRINNISQWLTGYDDFSQSVGNPLLANLGQQGREFLALLQERSTYQFDAFDDLINASENQPPLLLHKIQQDILTLSNAADQPQTLVDNSITITCAHSALREVQGLHDWLLHQFNQDKNLTPKDILVMCPQIEDYAPYVDAVFSRGWQDLASDIPPLPCSIADRVSKDAEPIVAAFLELLQLPDSRFQVSQLLAFLRADAVQAKFNFTSSELDKISLWLDSAAIHWGINQTHKAQVLNITEASAQFTWQQGLSRLMQGFAYGDVPVIYQEQLLLSQVEGNDSELLGRLMLVLELLQLYAVQLKQTRSALQWQNFLYDMLNSCFAENEQTSLALLTQAIDSLVDYCSQAHCEETLPLAVVMEFLTQHFSQPDPGRQFMVGQVTFCSMLPMRSIPFKIIAVLGLNDGDYPRQRKPQAFDLMQCTPPRLGDRSRRGDDRYLFLEAIISARQALYLSYQGRNIKNNAVKQPSLVLKELMEYLQLGYGWQCDLEADDCHLRQLPMQAFSIKNYLGQYASFDDKWLNLSNVTQVPNAALTIQNNHLNEENNTLVLNLADLIRFYQHPSKYFAQQQLDLYLQDRDIQLSDVEPFNIDQLSSYLYRENNISLQFSAATADELTQLQQHLKLTALLSGKLPELPNTAVQLDKWQADSDLFSDAIKQITAGEIPKLLPVQLQFNLTYRGKPLKVQLQHQIPWVNQQLVFYRSSTAKNKDLLQLVLTQICLQLAQNGQAEMSLLLPDEITTQAEFKQQLDQLSQVTGIYFDTKAQKATQLVALPFNDPLSFISLLLTTYLIGQEQALLLNGVLGDKIIKELQNQSKKQGLAENDIQSVEQSIFANFWQESYSVEQKQSDAFKDDPYIHYFWPELPEISEHFDLLKRIYLPVYQQVEKVS